MEYIVEIQERQEVQRFFTLRDAVDYARDMVARDFLVSIFSAGSAFRPGKIERSKS